MKETIFSIVLRWTLTLCLGVVCGTLCVVIHQLLVIYGVISQLPMGQLIVMTGVIGLLGLVLGWMLAPKMVIKLRAFVNMADKFLSELPAGQAVAAVFGFGIGLLIALLISLPFLAFLPGTLWAGFSVVMYSIFGTLGGRYAMRRWRDLPWLSRWDRKGEAAETKGSIHPKILDSSVLIDGRIIDLCKTGFLEGTLVVPQFILAELRHIADSSEALRRNRGRRGLDVLGRLQKDGTLPLEIQETDYDDVEEVDAKLLRLAKALQAVVVTNDFNLSKVADVTGVRVLNINALANAMKPELLPGEEMRVQIIREGKEAGQGVAYMEDGTMVVVDNARRLVGETVEIVVTTALQTSAGRMIFAKLKMSGL